MTENNSCSGNCSSCGEKGSCEDKLTKRLSIIKNKIMVLSGKGGVGKSSVAAALALSLSKKGKKVGIIDIDFHGPSIPVIFGIKDVQLESDGEEITPIEVGGIKIVSSGFMTNNHNDAFIWRGPMKMSILKTLLENVRWGDLDYLIMDFPPGTGDEALSACQLVKGGSGIIVTTPQELSLADCRRCISFCDKLNLPILGIIENMSGFLCPKCGEITEIFTSGGGEKLAQYANLPFLGKMPFDIQFVKACDSGKLDLYQEQDTEINKTFRNIVDKI